MHCLLIDPNKNGKLVTTISCYDDLSCKSWCFDWGDQLVPYLYYIGKYFEAGQSQPAILSFDITTHLATRRRCDVATTSLSLRPNDVAGTSQMKHPTTPQWNVFTTSYWCVVTTSQRNVMTPSHQYVSTTSQIRLKWNTKQRLSGTSPRLLSGTYPRRPISTFCDVSCNSQMKYPITSVWYVSTTSPSYVVATPCLFYCVYYVFQITLSWPPSGRFSRLI